MFPSTDGNDLRPTGRTAKSGLVAVAMESVVNTDGTNNAVLIVMMVEHLE